ncbi:tyrosine-type recombinase/integrase [Rhodohalobacter sp. 8-1]|uniref:tyrosine-type recombinase/integrase n=1 Tax=Rhodohalobacter sp. 8-1 TaxID=3131972 RepID=UPI0030EE6FAD
MPNIKLTDPFIKGLSNDTSKRAEYYDELVNGLALRITPTNHKSFVYRYRFHNKVKRYTIGEYKLLSLSNARSIAKELAYKISTGIDPLEERKYLKRKAKPLTVADLAEAYKTQHLPTLKESTNASYKSRINSKIIPSIGEIPLEELSKSDVRGLLEKIAIKDSNGTNSNRVRAILSSMVSFGVQKDWLEFNFVPSIKKLSRENSRDRIYSAEEIKKLWIAFEEEQEPMQSLLKMLLICGQRLGETRLMKWQDIGSGGEWTIKSSNTKSSRTHYVPIPSLGITVIEQLKAESDSEFIFESQYKPGKPLSYVGDAMGRIRDTTGIKDYINHDLRRTVASNIARLGYDRTIIGKVLNHSQHEGGSSITAVYDRYQYKSEVREALAEWGNYLENLIRK